MEISLKANYGYTLIFKAENVLVTEDIETRDYPKDENGKIIINTNPKRDISTDAIEQIANVLYAMMYYRVAEFDSSELIKSLFCKLPNDVATTLSNQFKKDYCEESN